VIEGFGIRDDIILNSIGVLCKFTNFKNPITSFTTMYTKEEVEVFRNPSQYLEWFEALLNRTNSDNNQKKEKLLHEGVFKQFYESFSP